MSDKLQGVFAPAPGECLASTEVVDADHLLVTEAAAEITSGAADDVDRTRRIFAWVRDEVPHTNDIGSEVVTCTASEELRHRTGICYAKSHLLAALCRATGVPAGFCYQRLRKDPPYEGFELHGFNAVYLNEHACWIRLDARGNKPGVDAQFSLDEPRLAFEVDPTRGESTDSAIHTEPLPAVDTALRAYDRLRDLWPNLPSKF